MAKAKSIFLTTLIAVLVNSIPVLKSIAQEFSGGIELGQPINQGDTHGLGIGASFRYESPWGTQTNLIIDGGYLSFSGKTIGGLPSPSLNIIPLQAGIKYYFDDPSFGFYASGQLGIHFLSIGSRSEQNFGFAPGLGYHLDKLDFGFRLQVISGANNESYNFLGIRVAYVFSEKTSYHRRRR